ncbi:MAG: hypothetical protein WDW38_006457 [Sanguina aurantia]
MAALGWSGLLPFAGALALAVLQPAWRDLALTVVIAYAAVILSFLGGARWGRGLASDVSPLRDVEAVLPSLIGFAALLLAHRPVPALGLLGAGYRRRSGRPVKRVAGPAGGTPVHLDIVADAPKYLEMTKSKHTAPASATLPTPASLTARQPVSASSSSSKSKGSVNHHSSLTRTATSSPKTKSTQSVSSPIFPSHLGSPKVHPTQATRVVSVR